MKKYICPLFALAVVLLVSSSLFANRSVYIKTKPLPPIRKSIQPVTLQDGTVGSLELLFRASVGSVAVAVEGEPGAVYQGSWQVTAGEQRNISIEDWEQGYYTLTLTLSNGATYAWELELVEE